jgi:hypothetical protein
MVGFISRIQSYKQDHMLFEGWGDESICNNKCPQISC